MKWHLKTFEQLSVLELYKLLQARVDVFVVEQECAYPELDDYDQGSLHLYLEMDGKVAANLRLLPAGTKYPEASIGRVLVTKDYRGKGYAQEMMRRAIGHMRDEWKVEKIRIQAQSYLKEFYGSFGFRQISDSYLEDGIPHIDMIWEENT